MHVHELYCSLLEGIYESSGMAIWVVVHGLWYIQCYFLSTNIYYSRYEQSLYTVQHHSFLKNLLQQNWYLNKQLSAQLVRDKWFQVVAVDMLGKQVHS